MLSGAEILFSLYIMRAIYLRMGRRVYFQFRQQCAVFRANYPLKYNAGDTVAAIGGVFYFTVWYKK